MTRKVRVTARRKGCDLCQRVYDPKGCRFSNSVEIASGCWVDMRLGVDEYGRVYMYATADDDTDPYYPKFCPECGRDLREEAACGSG